MVCYAVVIKNQLLVIINIYDATWNILYMYCFNYAFKYKIKCKCKVTIYFTHKKL